MKEKIEKMQDDYFEHEKGENKMASELLEEAKEELQKLEKIKFLCDQIITTLTLEKNQEHLPEPLREMAKHWQKRFKEY